MLNHNFLRIIFFFNKILSLIKKSTRVPIKYLTRKKVSIITENHENILDSVFNDFLIFSQNETSCGDLVLPTTFINYNSH
jgi:hypothetical protein